MTILHQPPPDAVQWDCPDCGDGYWLTHGEAAKGCPATHPSDCGAKLELRLGVVRVCRLDVDECARRCSGKPGSCDTYGDGLVPDGRGCRVAGRRLVVAEDGTVSVELDLVPQEPKPMTTPKPPSSLAALAIAAFGIDAQLAQVQEELAELIVAVSHYRRGRITHAMGLRGEIADVEIMLEQLRHLVNDPDAMDRTRARKRAKCLAAIEAAPF